MLSCGGEARTWSWRREMGDDEQQLDSTLLMIVSADCQHRPSLTGTSTAQLGLTGRHNQLTFIIDSRVIKCVTVLKPFWLNRRLLLFLSSLSCEQEPPTNLWWALSKYWKPLSLLTQLMWLSPFLLLLKLKMHSNDKRIGVIPSKYRVNIVYLQFTTNTFNVYN